MADVHCVNCHAQIERHDGEWRDVNSIENGGTGTLCPAAAVIAAHEPAHEPQHTSDPDRDGYCTCGRYIGRDVITPILRHVAPGDERDRVIVDGDIMAIEPDPSIAQLPIDRSFDDFDETS